MNLQKSLILLMLMQLSIGNGQNNDMITIENELVKFETTTNGSAFTKFQLKSKKINPLNWKLPDERLPSTNKGGFSFQGHFLALGTWGMPTQGEQNAGIKFYGEVNTEIWKITNALSKQNQSQTIQIACKSPIEKLDILREIILFDDSPVIKVEEKVTNNLPIGRPYNILQHATFGGKFINQKTIINSNATKGFYQNADYKRSTYSDIESSSYDWPNAKFPDAEINLELSAQVKKSYVSSHIFSENNNLGWATITNIEEGFLIGYVWNTNDYPWLNIWHQFEEGKVKGRAIEFATCGMWKSFEYMMSNDSRFFGQNSFEFIDAGATKSKSYYMFLLPIEKSFKKVKNIQLEKNSISLDLETKNGLSKKSISF